MDANNEQNLDNIAKEEIEVNNDGVVVAIHDDIKNYDDQNNYLPTGSDGLNL